jgi:hypothetical protein
MLEHGGQLIRMIAFALTILFTGFRIKTRGNAINKEPIYLQCMGYRQDSRFQGKQIHIT